MRSKTALGTLTADAVILTVSTPLVAAQKIRFRPDLTDKVAAASVLPLGLADKLFLAVDMPEMLPVGGHLIGNPNRTATGSYHLRPFGRPLIEGFFGKIWDLSREAFAIRNQLLSGSDDSIEAMSGRLGMNKCRLTSLNRLSYLAPEIVGALLAGRHPIELTPTRLLVFRAVGVVLLDGPRSRDTIRNLVILDDAFAEADDDVAALLRSALDVMADELPKAVVDRAAPGGLDTWRECFRIIQAREVWINYGGFIERHRPNLGPGIRERMEIAARVSDRDVESARRGQTLASERIRSLAQPGTILCLPTAPSISPLLATPVQDLESFRLRVMRLTCIAGLGGLPQITMPVGTASGCPVGLSFIGWAGADEVLLDLACTLARHCGLQL